MNRLITLPHLAAGTDLAFLVLLVSGRPFIVILFHSFFLLFCRVLYYEPIKPLQPLKSPVR